MRQTLSTQNLKPTNRGRLANPPNSGFKPAGYLATESNGEGRIPSGPNLPRPTSPRGRPSHLVSGVFPILGSPHVPQSSGSASDLLGCKSGKVNSRSTGSYPVWAPQISTSFREIEPPNIFLIAQLVDYISRSSIESETRQIGSLPVGKLMRPTSANAHGKLDYAAKILRLVAPAESSELRSITGAERADRVGRSRAHVLKRFPYHRDTSAQTHLINRPLKPAAERPELQCSRRCL